MSRSSVPGATPLVPVVCPSPAELGRQVASTIADGIEAASARGEAFILGCPSGRSPIPVLQALADQVAERGLDLRRVGVVMMDEYLVPGSERPVPVNRSLPHSCLGFALREIAGRLNRAAGPARGLDPERIWLPDPSAPDAFEELIARNGGIDVFLLATGASDGHIGFNPPGSARDSRTRVVALAPSTRQDNLSTFPSLGRVEGVPRHGVTVGIGTIREHSRRVVMVAHGADKALAVRRLRAATRYQPDWPSTMVVECANASLVIDVSAAGDGDH